MTPEERLARIKQLEDLIDASEKELGELIRSCSHEHVIDDDETAFCKDCGRGLGWYCPDNPTHVCEYGEDGEDCIHCGQPDERK